MTHRILYLASASPRRHEILKQLDIAHHVLRIPSPDGEDEPQLPGESPQDYVIRTARDKALHAAKWLKNVDPAQLNTLVTASHPDASVDTSTDDHFYSSAQDVYILSADTTVILNDRVLGKPADEAEAIRTLQALSGNTHYVHTAIALRHQDTLWQDVSISKVCFKDLSLAEITAYCRSGEPKGKAGSYGIQGRAAAFVSHLSGSYSGVMGLPAYETSTLLSRAGFL